MGNDDSTFEREREIFFAALEKKTEGSRSAYLQETCGDDEPMLERVREMLEKHHGDETETFLKPQDIPQPPGTLMEREGSVVGNYKLAEKLGEGGFGVVWMAEQEEPVKRKVALKLIKPGMDSAEVIARFGAERQALAVMDHPNIAKVFDAGATESGRPYFVMELAEGVPITEFCDREKLNTKERLGLFAVVCGAVQHAHQKAVIHRDLKPSNILVVDGDDGPVPKVIDFGIAKAIGEDVAERTAFTAHGQLVGTPQYMSPEQAGMGGADIDTRSDVYSLGVVLYELLAGSPPFDVETLRSAGFEGMCRIIREEEPPNPSTKLGTAKGEDATRITGTRRAEPQKLSRQVRGELDWIVMKAIEKDRGRRYETANALAADIGRYLGDEPVSAGPPSAAYRFKKFARRNKAVLTTAAIVSIVLVAATWVSVWQAVEAHWAREQSDKDKEQSDRDRKEAEAISEFMVGAFQSPDPARDGLTITVAEMLDAAAERLETDLENQPGRRAKLHATLGRTYFALGQFPEAIALQERVRDYHLVASGKEHPDTLSTMHGLAVMYYKSGRRDEALKMWEELLPLFRRTLGAENPGTLRVIQGLANAYHTAGRGEEALEMREDVLQLSRRVLGTEHPDALMAMGNLADSYHVAGRLDEALKLQEEVLPLCLRVLGHEHPDTLRAQGNLAVLFHAAGRLDEAIEMGEEVLELSRKVLGDEHPDTVGKLGNLAAFYQEAGRRGEALLRWEKALRLSRRVLGSTHPDTLRAMHNLAICYNGGEMALKLWEEVLPLHRKVSGQEHPDTLTAMDNLARCYHDAGRLDEAIRMGVKALALSRNVHGDEHIKTLRLLGNLGVSYFAAGRKEEALEIREEVLAHYRKVLGDGHEKTLKAMNNLAVSYRDASRWDEAIIIWEESLKLTRKTLGPEHPDTLTIMVNVTGLYLVSGRRDDAGRMLAQTLLIARERYGLKDEEEVAQAIIQSFQSSKQTIPVEEPSDTAVADFYELKKDLFRDTSIHLLMLSGPKPFKKREFMDALRKDLVEGGDFAAAVKQAGSDDSAASKGGDRGWVKRGVLREDMEEVVFGLAAGEVSEVFEDGTRFRIFKVVDRKEGTPAPLEEVREKIVGELKEEARKKRVADWIEEAKMELAQVREAREREKVAPANPPASDVSERPNGSQDNPSGSSHSIFPSTPEPKDKSVELARTLTELGERNSRKRDFDKAKDAHDRAVNLLAEIVQADLRNDAARFYLARNYGELGRIYHAEGHLKDASRSVSGAVQIFSEMVDRIQGEPRYAYRLAIYRSLQSEILTGQEKSYESIEAAEAAVRSLEKLVEEIEAEAAEAKDYQIGLAGAYESLGLAAYRAGKKDRAQESYSKATTLWEKLAKAFPEDEMISERLRRSQSAGHDVPKEPIIEPTPAGPSTPSTPAIPDNPIPSSAPKPGAKS